MKKRGRQSILDGTPISDDNKDTHFCAFSYNMLYTYFLFHKDFKDKETFDDFLKKRGQYKKAVEYRESLKE